MSSLTDTPVDRGQPTRPERPAPTAATRRRAHRRLAIILATQAALILAYWIAWAIDHSLVVADQSPEYQNFEAAFPLPDGLIAVLSALAARDLWASRSRGVVFVLLGAGAALFLGLIDVAYDLQNGIWTKGVNGAIECAVVVAILVSATSFALWGWFAFRRLAAGRQL